LPQSFDGRGIEPEGIQLFLIPLQKERLDEMGVQPITVPRSLAVILDAAGDKSGVDFDYLVNTAMRESSLDPKARAPSSSATGLFQFLDSTWLRVMKAEGPRLGYQRYADAIQPTRDGDYTVADKAMRAEILKLREDPQIASDLAAAYTRENGEYLRQKFGRMPSPGELYIAHFLGAQGAETLFRAGLSDPGQNAAKLFPRQAKANPTIFYEGGRARSVKELYRVLVADQRGDAASAAAAVAAATGAGGPVAPSVGAAYADNTPPGFITQQLVSGRWPSAAVPSRFAPSDMSFTSLFSNEDALPGRALMSPASEAQGSALFTGLYGQGPARPLEAGQAPPLDQLPMPPPDGVNER
jgi:hypothetical protein